jgi:UDP-N-acetylmuramoyl-L-alanyl-D-glutamate--2,6-diaminopimelate ligase
MTLKELVKKFVPKFLLKVYHYKLALLGAVVFGFPGYDKNLKIIGVTGTSGKSTSIDFITRILEEAGNKVASISSIRFKIGNKEWENKYKMTMPGRFVIQRFLKQAKSAGCNYVVLEVTSEGIRQFRHKFITFNTAVFTNLTPEHIESHKGFGNYRNEKIKLFKATKKVHIINVDDENSKYFLDIPAEKKITFGLKDVKNINTETGISFDFKGTRFNLNLIGEFNIYNAISAICVGLSEGISLYVCKKALEKAKGISGRMEIIVKEPFKVVVDYAHTPEQLKAVYKAFKNSPLVCVLGSCGGGRDKWKRPILGQIANEYCKYVIITNEDPYNEDAMEIINQVAATAGNNVIKILDRKEAIKEAIKLAKIGDTVIITGKGSEPWMCIDEGKKIPWSDKQIVIDVLNIK